MKTLKRKRGGKILGEGCYARVIYPAIPCKDGRDMKKYTSRVLNFRTKRRKPERDLISNNKTLLQRLSKIDPSQKYFIYPQQCEVGDLLEENIADGVTEYNKNYSEFMVIGVETWQNFYKHSRPSSKQKKHLKDGFELLHSNGIIHGDLSDTNVIIGDDNLPRIIDFAVSVYDTPVESLQGEKTFLESIFPSLKITSRQQKIKKALAEKIFELMKKQEKNS
jgi:serine/threonine protein kinase